MSGKNSPYRFTIRFYEQDYQQRYVAELLNGMGRRKAQYITAAILHYVNCTKDPDIPQDHDAIMQQKFEMMIQMAIEKLGLATAAKNSPDAAQKPKPKRKRADVLTPEDTGAGLEGLDMDAILKSLSAFNDQ